MYARNWAATVTAVGVQHQLKVLADEIVQGEANAHTGAQLLALQRLDVSLELVSSFFNSVRWTCRLCVDVVHRGVAALRVVLRLSGLSALQSCAELVASLKSRTRLQIACQRSTRPHHHQYSTAYKRTWRWDTRNTNDGFYCYHLSGLLHACCL